MSTDPAPIKKMMPVSNALSILASNSSDLTIESADLLSLQSLSDLYSKAKFINWQYKNDDYVMLQAV